MLVICLPDKLSKDLSFFKGKSAVDSNSFVVLFLIFIKFEYHVTGSLLLAKYALSQACKCLDIYASAILLPGTVKSIDKLFLL